MDYNQLDTFSNTSIFDSLFKGIKGLNNELNSSMLFNSAFGTDNAFWYDHYIFVKKSNHACKDPHIISSILFGNRTYNSLLHKK